MIPPKDGVEILFSVKIDLEKCLDSASSTKKEASQLHHKLTKPQKRQEKQHTCQPKSDRFYC